MFAIITNTSRSYVSRKAAALALASSLSIFGCLVEAAPAFAEKMPVQFKNDSERTVILDVIDGNDATVGTKVIDGKTLKKGETAKAEILVDPLMLSKRKVKEGYVIIRSDDADPKLKTCSWNKTYKHVPPGQTYSVSIPGCEKGGRAR